MKLSTLSTFVQNHFPVWYAHPNFCLVVLALLGVTATYWIVHRSKASMVILMSELLYFAPFVQ